jgi:hypothetical protein
MTAKPHRQGRKTPASGSSPPTQSNPPAAPPNALRDEIDEEVDALIRRGLVDASRKDEIAGWLRARKRLRGLTFGPPRGPHNASFQDIDAALDKLRRWFDEVTRLQTDLAPLRHDKSCQEAMHRLKEGLEQLDQATNQARHCFEKASHATQDCSDALGDLQRAAGVTQQEPR